MDVGLARKRGRNPGTRICGSVLVLVVSWGLGFTAPARAQDAPPPQTMPAEEPAAGTMPETEEAVGAAEAANDADAGGIAVLRVPETLDPTTARVPLADVRGVPAPGAEAAGTLDESSAERVAAAREMFADGRFQDAVNELDAALYTAHGDLYELLYLLARAKVGLGRFGEARVAALQAAAYHPGAADAYYLLAKLYERQGQLEEATDYFRAATLASAREPENPRVTAAWYELGRCLVQRGLVLAAAEAFERFDRACWDAQPQHRNADEVAPVLKQLPYGLIERRLELLGALGELGRRVAAAQWALESRPEESYLQRLYVRSLVDAGQAAEAFAFCRERLDVTPGEGRPESGKDVPGGALVNLAIEAAQAAGQLEAWIGQLGGAVAAGQRLEFAARVARRLGEAGQPAAAVPLWRALAAQQPASARVVWDLAGALRASGDWDGALAALTDFVRANPSQADLPVWQWEEWLRTFQQTDEFLRLVAERTARPDCDFATYAVLGLGAGAAGQPELAERLLGSALEARPDFALGHVAWGRLLVTTYQWAAAQQHAEQAAALDAECSAAYLLAGDAHAGLDEGEAAEAAYKRAIALAPRDVEAPLALARHYRRTGNALGAQRYFQEAWALDRTRGEAVEELIDTYLENDKPDIARTCLREAEAADVPEAALRRMRTVLQFAGTPLSAEHLAVLRREMQRYPGDTRTGLKLAAGLFIRDRVDEALAVLDGLQPRGTESDQALHLRGRALLRKLELRPAVAAFEELARRYPRRKPVLNALAEVYVSDFRLAEGREVLQRLLALDLGERERAQTRAQLLATYLDFMEYDGAEALLDEWMAAEPESEVWPRGKLRTLLAAERDDAAFALAETRLQAVSAQYDQQRQKLAELAGRRSAAPDPQWQAEGKAAERELTRLAEQRAARRAEFIEVCLDAKRYAAAETELRNWRAAEPEDQQIQEWAVEVLLAGEKPEEALTIVAAYVPRTAGDVLKVLTWRAQCYVAAKRVDDGVRELTDLMGQPVIQATPGAAAQVRQAIIGLLVQAQEYSRAVGLCDQWLETVEHGDQAGRYGVLMLKRLVLQAAEREPEHIAVSEELLKMQPRDPGLNNDLGYTWAERGENLARALEMIQLAVAAEPLNPAYLDSLGWVYYKRGNFERAREYLSRAVRLRKGQDATVRDHLGDAAYRLNDRAAAREHWQQAAGMLEKQATAARAPGDTALLAAIRAKLSALEAGSAPAVAPVGAGEPQAAPGQDKDKP
jgi:tetratricopeptide (TPR) repeat protein